MPLLKAIGAPKGSAPSINWTLPAAPVGATVAVKVTDCPVDVGLLLKARVVLVASGLTTSGKTAETLERKLLSPLYTAEMLCTPGDKDEVA